MMIDSSYQRRYQGRIPREEENREEENQ